MELKQLVVKIWTGLTSWVRIGDHWQALVNMVLNLWVL